MIDKTLDTIQKADIDALVDGKKSERRTLEYKAELPGDSDDAKREFLSDISSFANSVGGDILYGVTDERDANGQATGRPEQAKGISSVNETAEQLRLENMMESHPELRAC
jgi:predicted HTH transcriptional regulator